MNNIPGFVDLQVNGYKGINFSDQNLKLDDIFYVNRELLKKGTIGYCPTLISSSLETYERNLPIIIEAAHAEYGARILGIHLEGPFINPSDGPRGIHPRKQIKSPSISLFKKLYSLAHEEIALITIDPQQKGALELISFISKNENSVISIGHTVAGEKTIQKSVKLGAKAATHVGNGISEKIHRHQNPLWNILAEDKLSALFITDGFHLPAPFIKVALRAKGVSRFIVTSDLVHLAGFEPGEYYFDKIPVILESNGYLHRKNSYQLAGSTSTMLECMNVMATLDDLSIGDLISIGYKNPLQLLNRETIKKSPDAPIIEFDNGTFQIK